MQSSTKNHGYVGYKPGMGELPQAVWSTRVWESVKAEIKLMCQFIFCLGNYERGFKEKQQSKVTIYDRRFIGASLSMVSPIPAIQPIKFITPTSLIATHIHVICADYPSRKHSNTYAKDRNMPLCE